MSFEASQHRFSELFRQLYLADDGKSIDEFIATNSPLQDDVKLENAQFWNDGQRAFLRENLVQDADWAVKIAQLNEALRRPRK
ncbi:DUF2789 family protein [Streptomyces sp. NPDC017993]|uniref:DUF2789 family protein n=1 Tax=Streptomyces sp. NPDC017993 TaxID=3365027 RepID=UPI0037BE0679